MAYIKYGDGYVKFGDGFVKIYGDLEEYVEPPDTPDIPDTPDTPDTPGTFSSYLNPAYIDEDRNSGDNELRTNIADFTSNDYWAYQAIEVDYPLTVTSYSYADYHGSVFGLSGESEGSSNHQSKPFFAGLVFATNKTNPISGSNVTYSAVNKTGAMIFGDGSGLPKAGDERENMFTGGYNTCVPSSYFIDTTAVSLPFYHTVQPTTPFTLEPDKRYYFPVFGNNAKSNELYMKYQEGTLPSIPNRSVIIIPSGQAASLITNTTASINVAGTNAYHGPAGFLELNLQAV